MKPEQAAATVDEAVRRARQVTQGRTFASLGCRQVAEINATVSAIHEVCAEQGIDVGELRRTLQETFEAEQGATL